MTQIKLPKIFFYLILFIGVIPQLGYTQAGSQDIYQGLTQKLFPANLDKSRPVAICPFNYSSTGLEPFAKLVTERLTNAVVSSKKCLVVERTNLGSILSEARLSLTGTVNEQTAVKIGNLLGAKLIVTGTIEQDETAVHILARLVNVESGQIESSAEYSILTSPIKQQEPSPKNKATTQKSLNLGFAAFGEEDENKSPLDLLVLSSLI